MTSDPALASFERLSAYLAVRATLVPDEIDLIRRLFAPRHLKKGEFLQRAGEPARLVRRVPLRMLASYLGMSPETLSRIRKRVSTRASAFSR